MNEFVIAEVMPGKLNALVKNIMRQTKTDDPNEAVRLVNSGERIVTQPVRRWREKDGIIYLSVTSDSTTGSEWIKRLTKKGFQLSKWAKGVLNFSDFKATNGVTYEVGVIKGELFSDADRITNKIRIKAVNLKMILPNAEIACLIRENFSDKDIEAMGLTWITIMHEPIESDGGPSLLCVSRRGGGGWLCAVCGCPGLGWHPLGGFAFVLSQVGA